MCVSLVEGRGVTLVERWPDLGSKRGARVGTFLMQPNWVCEGQSPIRPLGEPGTKRSHTKRERKRDDCDSEQVKKTEMGILGSSRYKLYT